MTTSCQWPLQLRHHSSFRAQDGGATETVRETEEYNDAPNVRTT